MINTPISKVLLLDASFAAVPIHDYLVASGFDVWTVGNRSGDPLAMAFPNRWIQVDYSEVAKIRSLVDDYSFDAVIPGCTDVSMATFVRLGLAGPEGYTAQADDAVQRKDLFRQMCREMNLPAPQTFDFNDLPACGRFICKPVDSFSGRGATVFDAANRDEAIAAYDIARRTSPTATAICEEYVEGQLYSYSAFLKEGRVEIAFVVKEGSRYDPFAVDSSYTLDWSDHSRANILKEAVEKIAAHLKLVDGLVHVQFIMNEQKLALLEVTRRCPGDLYSKLIEYSTGFPYASKYASCFVGRTVAAQPSERKFILRHTVKQRAGTCFDGLDLDFTGKVRRVVPARRMGEQIEGIGFQRTALVFVEERGWDQLHDLYERLVGE